jgi:hypothetical protein
MEMNYTNAIGLEILPNPDDLTAARQAVSYLKKLEKEID